MKLEVKMYEDESYISRALESDTPWKYFNLYIIKKRKTVFCFGKEIKSTKATLGVIFDFIKYRETIKYITKEEYSEQKKKTVFAVQKNINWTNKYAKPVTPRQRKLIGNKKGLGYFLDVSNKEDGVFIVE